MRRLKPSSRRRATIVAAETRALAADPRRLEAAVLRHMAAHADLLQRSRTWRCGDVVFADPMVRL